MTFTKRISIERYKGEIAEQCAGLIEGETEDGESWIIYMDAQGRPEIYWPKREEDGAVVGDGISLKPSGFPDVFKALKPEGDEEIVSTFPVWDNGMRGIVFAIVPSPEEGFELHNRPQMRMIRFLSKLEHEFTQEGAFEDGYGDGAPAHAFERVESQSEEGSSSGC